ncbi:MAG TPA: TatD family hydrolase [Bacteroidales bacterium]|nr:TatD family hydrolase [Bacteroidales bacterium]
MELIDTHCHLFLEEFDSDVQAVVQRGVYQGVSTIINPNVDETTVEALNKICSAFPDICKPAYGIHPCSVKENYKALLSIIEKEISNNKPIAIGEIGLDLYWDKTFYKEQIDAFEIQLQWAKEVHLPVIIHTRDAVEQALDIVQKHPDVKGVFHAFSGTVEQAKRAIDLGYVLGIGGVVTFKNGGLDKIIGSIDLKNLVLETDAPYLTPTPYRGKRNEPAYLQLIVSKLSEIYQVEKEQVTEVTTLAAKSVFNL